MLELTSHVLIRVSFKSAREAMESGKLQGLGWVIKGGVVWVSGQVRRETLAVLLGTQELPVLMALHPLSKSLMRKAHREDHRQSPQDIAARTRRVVWIMGATRVAKEVASKCYECCARDKKMAKQLMGGLPHERTSVLAPFEALVLDLFGHFMVKDPVQGQRSFKCWVVVFICLATKAVSMLPCKGELHPCIPGHI